MADRNGIMSVIIVGGGAAGISAAISASKNGADTLLVESGSSIGGDLFSGMPLLGTYTSLGNQCVHGILDEIIDTCNMIDPRAYIGPVCDWRTVYGLCIKPEILCLGINSLLRKYCVKLLLNSMVTGVNSANGTVTSLRIATQGGKITTISCDAVVDASGGGNITAMAGGEILAGDENRNFQPVSLVFRMANVQFESLLRFIRDNPEEALLAENPVLKKKRAEAAMALYNSGYPYVAISANGKVLGQAIKTGAMHPCTAAFVTPTSILLEEVCLNATRIGGIDCTDEFTVSATLPELAGQVANTARFFKERIPGFENASISSIAHRVGVRETGRIKGEYTLSQSDVIEAVKHTDVIARGCHHVDIHGAGTAQVRIPVKDGQYYDIPFRCLLPLGLKNVIAAGRCISSDRGANGSLRVMGTCIATGQAAGMAAAILSRENKKDFRSIKVNEITEYSIR